MRQRGPGPRGPDPRHELGRRGEAAAEAALLRAGLTILERRYRRARGEIDLIAARGDLLVFVEVKTRTRRGAIRPADAVGSVKRRRMAAAALDYLARHGWLLRPCRFDVVEVLATGPPPWSVHHIPDAFRLWRTG